MISVIVLIYNVEKYLERCFESLKNQTYKDLEILLIDDGSTDKSAKMCDDFAKEDNRVKVIHQKNGGIGVARERGLAEATGEYICFLDGDDWADSQMIEKLYKGIKENDSDFSICYIQITNGTKNLSQIKHDFNKKVISPEELMSLGFDIFANHLCNKMFKSEIIKNIPFGGCKSHEDAYAFPTIIERTKKIAVISEALYYYYYREDSNTNRPYNIERLGVNDAWLVRVEWFLKRNNHAEAGKMLHFVVNTYSIGYNRLNKKDKEVKEKLAEIKRRIKEKYKIINWKKVPKKERYLVKLFIMAPRFYTLYRKIRTK